MEWIVLLVIGLCAGTLGSLVGLGGGIIIVPGLLYIGAFTSQGQEMTPQLAVGTSLIVMIFTGLSSTLSYMKHKTIDYKSGLLFFLGSGPGGIAGAWMNKGLKMEEFNIYFGIFMIIVAIILMVKKYLKPISHSPKYSSKRTFIDPQGIEYTYGYHPALGILISFVVGFCSGLFGIGGGSLMVPAMILLFLFPAHVATATSMFIIFLSSIVSSSVHAALGNVDWLYAGVLIPGAWFGAKAGVYLNTKLPSKTLVNILRVVIIIVGVKLIYEGISG
ncbi:sulfite exporter TauE/SafE family protein [Falsibacillus albus]|uniref:Probable membrane transporter protein n=1 Tax=Falsibacillus albus TaxID=2478915 RepID=A0A3L7K0H7_9BACI|nr:sulfite exporter TauE/SafE family protein [Falsibacillus albus]RLQ96546.1 sulfite exporter TauE/SafE family protein [Falsibacillus albus]